MSISAERSRAEQHYNEGHALFQRGRYREAIIQLQAAENDFRSLDARGTPFSRPLPNGISGLATSLALTGLCHQKLGDYRAAVSAYETSFINAKFERKFPFRRFKQKVHEDMRICYEKLCQEIPDQERDSLLRREHEIGISFRFPYSLPPEVVPFARLYELFPKDYVQYAHFYNQAHQKDLHVRRGSRSSDELVKKRMSFYVWGILLLIWAVYGFIMLDALVRANE